MRIEPVGTVHKSKFRIELEKRLGTSLGYPFWDPTEVQEELVKWFKSLGYTLWVTFVFNRTDIPYKAVVDTLEFFHAVYDREALGKQYFQYWGNDRTNIVGIVENKPKRNKKNGCKPSRGKLHVHGFLRPADLDHFIKTAPILWKEKCCKAGSLVVQKVYEAQGAGQYTVKELRAMRDLRYQLRNGESELDRRLVLIRRLRKDVRSQKAAKDDTLPKNVHKRTSTSIRKDTQKKQRQI